MKLRWFYRILAILPTTLLGACYSTQSVDTTAAMLMPDTVAQAVLSKYFGEDWVKKPYATTGVFCSNSRVPIKISDIKTLFYNTANNKAYIEIQPGLIKSVEGPFNCKVLEISVPVQREADVTEIANALVSLGSSIKGMTTIFIVS